MEYGAKAYDGDEGRSCHRLFARSPRPGSSKEKANVNDNVLSAKVSKLPPEMKATFHRLMSEIYEQESDTMISFIDDARHSLALTLNDLKDEQEVLSLTANKIREARSAKPTADRLKPPPSARPDGRIGAIAARQQRILSAKHERQPEGPAPAPRPTSARPGTANGGRPATASRHRPAGSESSPCSSSLDSITFETERAKSPRFTERGSTSSSPTNHVPAFGRSATSNELTVQVHLPPRPASANSQQTTTVLDISDGEEEYKQEKDEIMKRMSGAHTQIDKERERQNALLRERKEKKKAQQDHEEKWADALVREASVLEDRKLKDKERQEQLIRERIEERKRRKQEAEQQQQQQSVVVVHEAPPTRITDFSGENDESKNRKGHKKKNKKISEEDEIEELELQIV